MERNINVWLPLACPQTGDPARNSGMCPDWESSQRPFCLQAGVQSTEPHQPGQPGPLRYHEGGLNSCRCTSPGTRCNAHSTGLAAPGLLRGEGGTSVIISLLCNSRCQSCRAAAARPSTTETTAPPSTSVSANQRKGRFIPS